MSKRALKQKYNRKKIAFSLYAPQAREVFVFGDFNKWDGKKHPMKKGDLGTWRTTIMLPPGTYEYKYNVDGKWQEDPENPHSQLNAFGTLNNCLTVE